MPTRRATPPTAAASHVLVRAEHPRGAYAARVVRTLAKSFLVALPRRGELSVVIATDRAIRKLNRDWRGKDKPTDVLSFPQDAATGLLGDVVISLDTAKRQAGEGGRPLADELARLFAHGLLHLVGHDHEIAADAKRMAKAEVALLGRVGLVGEALAHPSELEFRRARRAPPTGRSRRARATRKEKP